MILLLIFIVLAVPYLVGSAFITIFGERRHRGPIRWIVGALSLLVCFLACLLVALKLDFSLYELCKIYGIVCASFTAGSVPVFAFAVKNKMLRYQTFDKKVLIWMIPALILGIFSIGILRPVYTNDITMEIVRTTLASGKIYEISALLGTKMEAGLPIFAKIEIMPMLYAVLCRDFNADPVVVIEYLAPAVTYIANMFLMWEISGYLVKEKQRSIFMLFHTILLVAGTYLPETAIPVTAGQPLLLQGYSGYAWAYGVVAPAVVLMLLDRRIFLSGWCMAAVLGLMKFDRLFFAVKDFLTSYHLMNSAGKMYILYIVAFALWLIKRSKGDKEKPWILLSGSVLVSFELTNLYERFGEKRSYIFASILVILACCGFVPFAGTTTVFEAEDVDISLITGGRQNVTIWAPKEVMCELRRKSAYVKPIYGRDLYEELLDGVNYEPYSEDVIKLCESMGILDLYMDEYVEDLLMPVMADNKAIDDIDIILLPKKTYSDKLALAVTERGFPYSEDYDDYVVMRRYD